MKCHLARIRAKDDKMDKAGDMGSSAANNSSDFVSDSQMYAA